MRDFATLAQRAGKDLAFQVAASAAMRVLHKVLVPLLEKHIAPRLKRASPAAADLLGRAVDLAIRSPFERVKTLLQIAPGGTSAIEVATRAVAADGAAGCLRRVAQDVCLDLLRRSIKRWISSRLKPLMKGWKGPFLPPAANGVFLGSVATAVTLAATHPIDALRTRNYASEELAFVWSGWYRGYGFSVAGGALHRAVYVFGSKLFEKLDKRLAPRLAISVARLFSYPADTIRRRLQLDDARKYRGALDCLVVTFREEGISGLYGGVMWWVLFPPVARQLWNTLGILGIRNNVLERYSGLRVAPDYWLDVVPLKNIKKRVGAPREAEARIGARSRKRGISVPPRPRRNTCTSRGRRPRSSACRSTCTSTSPRGG